jgi:hypothetical protein
MSTGGILLLFASIFVGLSAMLALLFRFWAPYGSVTAAVEQSDRFLERLNAQHPQH